MSDLRDKVNSASNPKPETDSNTFGAAFDMGDMTEQGIKAADNVCATFYRAFNGRMKSNLTAMRKELSGKSILIPADQKALAPSSGSFLDCYYEVPNESV